MKYNFSLDIAAFVMALVIIVQFNVKRTIPSRRTKVFLLILFLITVASIADIGSSLALDYIDVLPLWINHLLLMIYDGTTHAAVATYLYYALELTKGGEKDLTLPEKLVVIVPYTIDLVMTLSSPLTGIMYTIDENLVYHPGWGIMYAYVVSFIYLIAGAGCAIVGRKNLRRRERFVIFFFTVTMLVCFIIQIAFQTILITMFGCMICILTATFTLENPTYYEDQQLGVYNLLAFQTLVKKSISDNRQFTVLGVYVEGMADIRELIGIHNVGLVLRDLVEFFSHIGDKNSLFRISDNTFAFILYEGEAEVDMYTRKISTRFNEAFGPENANVRLFATMSRFAFPGDVKTSEGTMDLLEYSLSKASERGGSSVLTASEKLLNEKKRTGQVLQVIQNALAEKRFSIYYQPIYSVELGGFNSAEALLRLYDDELGFISPDEFIPIAEKKGLIISLGDYVFRETCRYISENKIWQKGIKYIDINLSPIQCNQPDLADKYIAMMDEFHIDYSMISLEITETSGIMSGRTFRKNMQKLIDKGVRFSLDDYGTGYSNIATLVDYPFSIIKLDKTMLWSAMKNDNAMVILRQTVRMIKQMGLELIAEGVETEEQAQILTYYGCDFFQGFFYAKPQAGEAFIKVLDEKQGSGKFAISFAQGKA